MLASPQWVVGHGVHPGEGELVHVGVLVAAVGTAPDPAILLLPLLAVTRLKENKECQSYNLTVPVSVNTKQIKCEQNNQAGPGSRLQLIFAREADTHYPLFVSLEASIIFFA